MQEIDFKRFMFEQKIKQTELVDYLGVSKGYISLVIAGKRKLSDENLRKLINNPFGWDVSLLTGASCKDSEVQPQNLVTEQPEEQGMFDKLFFLVESQRKDIETLIQLVKNKDEKIEELLEELDARKKGDATNVVSSSSASAV